MSANLIQTECLDLFSGKVLADITETRGRLDITFEDGSMITVQTYGGSLFVEALIVDEESEA